jgi:hypothetical protein
MKRQNERVLKWLQRNGSITAVGALERLGVGRLAARIHDLRKAGYKISTIYAYKVNSFGDECRFARYVIDVKNK